MPDTLLSDDDLRTLNDRFEHAPPNEIVRWALAESGLGEIALAAREASDGDFVPELFRPLRSA